MDFARKQLEKYGWTDGKGLGKNENGISEAIKPKLKRGVAGIGHDAAADFTEHWWSQLYDKAAKNVEVKEKNGKTKKIKTKDDQFKITNSTYHLTKPDSKPSENEEYSDFFVKTVVLTNGGTQERLWETESEDEDETEKKDVFKMTDEELFAACEGRTAHKGARHGLKSTGKLARIERQEKELLVHSKYTGYSQSKKINKNPASDINLETVENTNINEEKHYKPKKKRRKHKCSFSDEKLYDAKLPLKEKDIEITETNNDVPAENKSKQTDVQENEQTENIVKHKKKKKHTKYYELEAMETEDTVSVKNSEETQKLKKKKKRKDDCVSFVNK